MPTTRSKNKNVLYENTLEDSTTTSSEESEVEQKPKKYRKNLCQKFTDLFTPEKLSWRYTRITIIRLYCYYIVGQPHVFTELENLSPKELRISTTLTEKDKLLKLINEDQETLTKDWTNFINHFVTDEAIKNKFARVLSPPTLKDMTTWKNLNYKSQIDRDKKRLAETTTKRKYDRLSKRLKENEIKQSSWTPNLFNNEQGRKTLVTTVKNLAIDDIFNNAKGSSTSLFNQPFVPLQVNVKNPKTFNGTLTFNAFKK